MTRREQYALATKEAIVDAARRLFAQRGYFAAKVDDIAAEAEVAPATVYAVTGGKQGLIAELTRRWQSDPVIAESFAHVATEDDPAQVVRMLLADTRQIRERWADVIGILRTTAPHDEGIARQLDAATESYRAGVALFAGRLAELGALPDGVDTGRAADILWFYSGYGAFITLHDELCWTEEQAEQWLADQAIHALVDPG
ncbi:MAG TPA: helix-turn-helix domain-containing protein [Solirubrobacteraceae bacterium]|nr:helix-turn-helix domain-containing protein [Solirubrobacteraceae bacterium]